MGLILLLHQLRLGTVMAFYASLLFPAVVAPFWPWWKESFGWNIILFDYSFCVVALPSWLNITFNILVKNQLFWGWFEVVGIYSVTLSIIVRVIIIYRKQRKAIRRKHERQDNATTRHQ